MGPNAGQQERRRQQASARAGARARGLSMGGNPKKLAELSRASRKVLTQVLREASHLQIGHLERQFWAWDEHISGTVYSGTKRSPLLKALCALLSISGDEAVWFILPVILASILAIAQGGPHGMTCGDISCDMEFFLDLFGGMAVCAFVEQVLKGFFQRPRPTCRPYDNTYCCILGEGYSFPSGHSMRALYAFNWLFCSAHASFMLNLPQYLEPFVLVWALGVGYARVAAGRHHPIDVIVGDVVGLAVSRVVENQLTDRQRMLVKSFCGVVVAIQVWWLLLGPLLRDSLRGLVGGHKRAVAAMCVAGAAYFAFYSAALLSIVNILLSPAHDCVVGRFSLALSADEASGWQCKQWTAALY